jgi:DNA-binding GntR family transcriptional regulator
MVLTLSASNRNDVDPARGDRVRSQPSIRSTVALALTEALRERILAGEFPDGSQLRQDVIAKDYQVSRIPVREAFRQLDAEGLIQISPHKGAVVPSLSVDEIIEMIELRALLESDQLGRAIKNMSDEDIGAAQAILDEFDLALSRNENVMRWGEMNWQFHRALYKPAARPRSLRLIQNLHHNTDRYSRMQLMFTDWRSTAQHEHRTLLAYCRKRDSSGGVDYLRQHITSAGAALVTFLASRREARGQDSTAPDLSSVNIAENHS